MKIAADESIVTAFCEYASGPGWSNALCTVIVRGADGSLRREYLQPNEQPPDVHTLFSVSAAAHAGLVNAIEREARRARKKA
jgi:hypothetical protein